MLLSTPNKEWLQKLKAGDKVFVRGGGMNNDKFTLHLVDRVTPTGRIRVGTNLYHNGSHKVPNSWNSYELEKYTPELEKKLRAEKVIRRMRNKIDKVKVWELPPDVVKKIYDILMEEEEQ